MAVAGAEGGWSGGDVKVGDGPLGGEEGEAEAEGDKEWAGSVEKGGGALEGAEEHCGCGCRCDCGDGRRCGRVSGVVPQACLVVQQEIRASRYSSSVSIGRVRTCIRYTAAQMECSAL